jgi:hypothetical protein
VSLWEWTEIQELLRTRSGVSQRRGVVASVLGRIHRINDRTVPPRTAATTLPRVLSNLVTNVTDAVADVRNCAARSVDDMFARFAGFVGDVSGRSTCTEHEATGQDRKQRVWKNRFCLHSP